MKATGQIRRVKSGAGHSGKERNSIPRTRITTAVGLAIAVGLASAENSAGRAALPSALSFHFMQIEQVIGGVNGNPSVQAIQLRMRTCFQDQIQQARLVVYDGGGSNPIDLIIFPNSVPNEGEGVRILIVSPKFADFTDPPVGGDFTMTNLIPPSYLPAGSLTYEDSVGTVYWRLSWGGSNYTGSTRGSFINDPNGDFGPPFAGPLPSSTLQAVRFLGRANAQSNRNVDDYALTNGAAVFTNNAGRRFTVVAPCEPCDMDCDGQVNAFDIEPFLDLLFGPGEPCDACTGDVDGNGEINAFDIEPFLQCLFP